MHVFLLDYYAQQWHEGKNCTPARRWEESLQAGYVPALDHSAEEVRILLYPGEKRVPGRSGIEFEVMHYQSEELKALRSVLPKGTEVTVKYDPEDISILYVYDEYIKKKWIKAYAIDQEYTRGLSLWKHRIIRKNVLRQKGEVDIEALAEAKARIQQIVEDEYMMTKKSRGRKRAARYLNNGAETSSESASNESQANTTVKIPEAAEPDDAQADTLANTPKTSEPAEPITPDSSQVDILVNVQETTPSTPSSEPPTSPPESSSDDEEFDTTGWSGDYNLPQRKPYDESSGDNS